MTTVAYDGFEVASDSLTVDAFGLKGTICKIHSNKHIIIGGAGDCGHVLAWVRAILHPKCDIDHILKVGYQPYVKEDNEPSLMVVDRHTGLCYRHMSGQFDKVGRKYHAIGSGRDFALAAMALGRSAREAVALAMQFDNGTGGDICALPWNAKHKA